MKNRHIKTLITSMFFVIFFIGLMNTNVAHAQTENYSFVTNWTLTADAGRTPSPTCIAVDSSNNVYVADYNNELIEKFTSNGTLITEWPFQDLTAGKVGQRGIAVDSDGSVYVIDEKNPVIKKFNLNFPNNYSLNTSWTLVSDTGLTPYPTCIAVDSSNNVYVADYTNDIVQKFASNGTPITKWAFQDLTAGKVGQNGIAVDSYGNVYVIEEKNPVIKKFNLTSLGSYSFATSWTLSSDDGTTPYPTCIAVDSSNNVYVADYGNELITKFSSNGTPITKWAFQNNTYNRLGQNGIAVDSSGSVYVIDGMDPKINKFTKRTFLPNPNGYNFENRGDSLWFSFPIHSMDEFRNTYNNNVNHYLDLDVPNSVDVIYDYNLCSSVTTFYNDFFKDIGSGGNCFGMSATSLLLYNKGVNNVFDYDVNSELLPEWINFNSFYYTTKPKYLRTWIATYQPLQADYACLMDSVKYKGPTVVCSELKKHLSNGKTDMVLGIVTHKDGERGHALVPYRIEDNPDGESINIYVYDSNHPGTLGLYVRVNPKTGKVYDYESIKNIDSIYLISLEAITKTPQIPIKVYELKSNVADLLYTDSSGRKLGYDQGVFKDEISDACSLVTLDGTTDNDSLESYYVPDSSLKMELYGTGSGDSEVSMLTSKGLITAKVPVSTTSIDEFKVLNDGKGIEFKSETSTTPSLGLTLDVEASDSAQIVQTNVSQIEMGGSVSLCNDNGSISLQNYGQSRKCTLILNQLEGEGISRVTVDGINIEADSTIYAEPSNWSNLQSSTITIKHDVGSDGTIDSVQTIDPNSVLPLPVANFTSNVTTGYAPLTVQFTDLSKNATSWKWNFGDATYSTEQNPVHTYTEEGNFTVLLNSSNSVGYDVEQRIIYVVNDSAPELALIGNKSVSINELLSFNISATDADGDAILYSATGLPTGAIFDTITGSFSWIPGSGAAGTYDITFNATANGMTDSESIRITVLSNEVHEDQPPVLALIGNKSVSVNELLSFPICAIDADGDAIAYSSVDLPSGATLDAVTGVFNWTPDTTGTYDVTFNATANGKSDSETIKITVSQLVTEDHAPELTLIGNKSISVNSLLILAVSATDSDGDMISYSATGLPTGAVFDPITATFSWTPSITDVGTYYITFSAVANGKTDSEIITITVLSNEVHEDQPPVLAAIGAKSVNIKSLICFTISANDPDGDVVKYSATGLPCGAKLDATTGKFTWTPTAAGTYTIKFIATANSLSDYETVKITVKNTNKPPVLACIGSKTIEKGKQLSFTITARDPDGDKVKYSATGLPKGAKLDATTGKFTWTPTAAGTYTVKFIATANGQSDYEIVKITVKNDNKPPVLACIGSKTVKEGKLLCFTVSAKDPDGDNVKYSATGLPKGAKLDASTGKFTWTPGYSAAGTYSVKFTATANGQSDSEIVKITVKNVK